MAGALGVEPRPSGEPPASQRAGRTTSKSLTITQVIDLDSLQTSFRSADGQLTVAPGAPGVVQRTPESGDGPAGDPGLFGPDSASWRVHGDPLMAIGGLRALLLQSLHPVVAQGFDSHSSYRENAWPRLLRTADFVALTTFGPVNRVNAAAAYVRRAHAHGHFVDPRTGQEHRLDEPELLLWVHCCLVESMLAVTTRGGLRLDPAEADGFVAEQVRAGALLGVSSADAPASTAELAAYFERMRPELGLSAEARDAVAIVLAPPIHPVLELLTPARVGWSSLAALAFSTLPSWARAMFPIPMGSGTGLLPQIAVTGALLTLRRAGLGVQSVVPVLRRTPHEAAARRRLGLD